MSLDTFKRKYLVMYKCTIWIHLSVLGDRAFLVTFLLHFTTRFVGLEIIDQPDL